MGRVLVSTMIHGNEFGPLRSLVAFIERAIQGKRAWAGLAREWVFVIGNPEAGLQGRRFLEQDLGRMFHPDAPHSQEKLRAQALMPVLAECDLLLDLHQTIEPCRHPFFIFGYHAESANWAQALSPGVTDILVTRSPGSPFAAGQMCPDEYVRSLGQPALTIELGQKGFSHETDALTMQLLDNLFVALKEGRLANRAPAGHLLRAYQIVARLPFDGPSCLLQPGFRNFDPVVKGQVLGRHDAGHEMVCPQGGFLLFPKYPPRTSSGHATGVLPSDIALVLQELAWQASGEPAWP